MLTTWLPLLALVAMLLAAPSSKGAVTIKMATMAPEGTAWFKALRALGDEWASISGGQVQVRIYAGGVAGNETVMVRKMRIGQLQATALTNLGVMDIDPASQVTNTPMLIRSYAELDYVMEHMHEDFERRLAEKGFVVLNWGDAGWVHLFSKTPLTDPTEVGNMKIYAWEGDPAAVEAYRTAGFMPVVVASTDIIPSLQSGLIDAFPSTPLGALALQWFALAPNMLDVPWAPLMGATIITKDTWNSIPAEFHGPFMEAALRNGADIQSEIRRQDTKAVSVMQKYGLVVNSTTEAQRQGWEQVAMKSWPVVRTKMVPPDVFDRAKALVEEYRKAHP